MRRILGAVFVALLLCACARERETVVLIPIGPVSRELLVHLQRELPATTQRDVIIGNAIPLPSHAFVAERKQYLGNALLVQLEQNGAAEGQRVLGILDADAYAPGLHFIFGQARKPGRFAFIALGRLRAQHPDRLNDRALKVATHELGHTLGFAHCDEWECVMHFARSTGELDASGVRFCERERF